MVDYRISVTVDPSRARPGLKEVEQGLSRTERAAKQARDEMGKFTKSTSTGLEAIGGQLTRLATLFGAAFGIGKLIELADTYTNIQNRLRTVTDGQEQLAQVTEELFAISNRTRASFESTAELYARVGLAAKDLGVNQRQLLQFTETLNQAIILSGASATEAQAGLIQLSQGLASGALRGDELRSVLEQLPVVADVIAKELGVTRGQLRAMGQDGKITADIVLRAFANARGELGERFGGSVATLGQSMTVLKNNLLSFVGGVDQATGASTAMGKVLLLLAENVKVVSIAVVGLSTAILVGMVQRALPALLVQLGLLKAAVLTNPLFLAAGGAAAAVGLLIVRFSELDEQIKDVNQTLKDVEDGGFTGFGQVGNQIRNTQDQIKRLQDILAKDPSNDGAVKQLQRMQEKLAALRGESKRFVDEAEKQKKSQDGLTESYQKLITDLQREEQLLGLSNQEREVQNKLIAAELKLKAAGTEVTDQQRAELEARIRNIQKLQEENRVLEDLRGPELERENRLRVLQSLLDQAKISQQEFNLAVAQATKGEEQGPDLPPEIDSSGFGLPTTDVQLGTLEAIQQQIKREGELLQLSNQEREVQNQLLAIEQQLRADGSFLLDSERVALEEQIRLNQELAMQKQAEAELLAELRGPQEESNARYEAANRLFSAGKITIEEYEEALLGLQESARTTGDAVFEGFSKGFDQAYKQLTDVSTLAQGTVVNAFGSAEDALVNLATTGEANFSQMVDSILKDVARLLARQALLALVNAFVPGGGAISGFLARAEGGPVQANRPYLVGEEGPEIFNPSQSGQIIPNDATQAMLQGGAQGGTTTVVQAPAPNVNINVVNVTDPKEALSALDTPEGTQKVLNVIRRNPTAVKRN